MPIRVFSEEEKERLKNKMLEAGFPLLKKYGMTHTSVSKIAEAAEIGTSTFYNFFGSKEEYMAELIVYHRARMMSELVPPDVLCGKRKLGRSDAKSFLFAMIDREQSIYPYMTLEDEALIMQNTGAFAPDIEKETGISDRLFSMLEGVRRDIDAGVTANLVKIFVLAAEARQELHSSAYDKTMDILAETVLDIIFEEELK